MLAGVELESTPLGTDPDRSSEDVYVLMLNPDDGSFRWVRHYGGGVSDRGRFIQSSATGDIIAHFNTGGAIALDGETLEPAGTNTSSLVRITEP